MNATSLTILAILVAFAGGAVARRQALTSAQPLRIKLAERGESLLARSDLPPGVRTSIENRLDDVFPSSIFFMFLLAALAPIAVPLIYMRSQSQSNTLAQLNPEVRGAFFEFAALHRRISQANHPIGRPLIELEVSILMSITAGFLSLTKRPIQPAPDSDALIVEIEQRQKHIWPSHMKRVAA